MDGSMNQEQLPEIAAAVARGERPVCEPARYGITLGAASSGAAARNRLPANP